MNYVVAFDVNDLDRSVEFYGRTLGFVVINVRRQGLLLESRELVSDRYPGLGLHLRQQFGIRVGGTRPGHILRMSLHTTDLRASVAALHGQVRWIGHDPTVEESGTSVRFADPDGYELELFTQLAGLA